MQMWCCTDRVEADSDAHSAENRNQLKNVIYLYINTYNSSGLEWVIPCERTDQVNRTFWFHFQLPHVALHLGPQPEFPPSGGDRRLIGRMWHTAGFTSPVHSEVIALQVVRTQTSVAEVSSGPGDRIWMDARFLALKMCEKRNSFMRQTGILLRKLIYSLIKIMYHKKTWDTLENQALGGLLILC